jgi:hypothetical protein
MAYNYHGLPRLGTIPRVNFCSFQAAHSQSSNNPVQYDYYRSAVDDRMNSGTIVSLVTAFVILLLLFIFSIIAWELFRRDYS